VLKEADHWKIVVAWPVGRGFHNLRESQLLVLERQPSRTDDASVPADSPQSDAELVPAGEREGGDADGEGSSSSPPQRARGAASEAMRARWRELGL